MRRIFLFIFSIVLFCTAFSNDYEIVNEIDSVYYKQENDSWSLASQFTVIGINDSINNKIGKTIVLSEQNTGIISKWDKQGICMVGDIIESCSEQSQNKLKYLAAKLVKNIFGESLPSWSVIGGNIYYDRPSGYFKELDHSKIDEYQYLRTFRSALNASNKFKRNKEFEKSRCFNIVFHIDSLVNDEYYYSISNHTSDYLYVNVIVHDKYTEKLTVLYKVYPQSGWAGFALAPDSCVSPQIPIHNSGGRYDYTIFGIKIDKLDEFKERTIHYIRLPDDTIVWNSIFIGFSPFVY